MRIFCYKCDLPAEMVLERFERFMATERHNPFNPFNSFDNPRVGLHTYRNDNEINGIAGALQPQGNVTRAQVAKMLFMME